MNQDVEVAVYDNTISARTYLSYISEQAGGFAYIGRDGKLYIKIIGEYTSELPIKYFQDFKWGENFKISRVRYEDGIQLFEAGVETNNTIYINQENMYIVNQEQIDNIYNTLNGLEIYSFEGNSIIDPALDVGDLLLIDGKYVIYQGSSQYGGKFKANISSKIQCKSKEETTTRIPSQKTINRRVESRINQVEGSIEQTISEVDDQNQKISNVTQTVNELNSKISDIADITVSKESTNAIVEFEKINQSEPIRVVIRPIGTNISYLYPMKKSITADGKIIGLFPSNDLYLPNRRLRFTNITTNKYIDYELPADLLYCDAENYDEFILDYEAQSCVVNKRVAYATDGTTYLLEKPTTIEYEYPRIELEDGDYTVELLGYSNAYLFVRLMTQNIYTTQFATKAEVNSEISQTAQEIGLSVDKKLEDYSTNTQMNAAINVKANEIISNVGKTYSTKNELTTAKSEIKQTTDTISQEVEKKVDAETITGAYLILKINSDTSEAKLSADKIELSANDILNLLAGNTINLKSNNIEISSDNFKVTTAGVLTAISAILKNVTIENGKITIAGRGNLFVGTKDGEQTNINPNEITLYDASGNTTSIQSCLIWLADLYGSTSVQSSGIETPLLTQTSLEEQKKNFEKLENALDIIKNVDIYKYNMKFEEDNAKKHIGFVIGEDFKYSKELTNNNNTGADIYSLASICLKAIQELQEQIQTLQNEIKILKGEQ